jgi:hypothetical protein
MYLFFFNTLQLNIISAVSIWNFIISWKVCNFLYSLYLVLLSYAFMHFYDKFIQCQQVIYYILLTHF